MEIGIDLGTTFSVLAVNGRVELQADYGEGQYLEEIDVTLIPGPDGELSFPTVVMRDPDNPSAFLFGHDALQRAEEGHAPIMFSKRKIGTNERLMLGDEEVTAMEVAAIFLGNMKRCAEAALGEKVDRAVITHPAYFDRFAVEETRQAAIRAGFDVSKPEQMLMEPIAAALSCTRADTRDPLSILTYDLGGGTFDVTCLERRQGVISVRSFDGNHLLGGYNFDRELVTWLLDRLAARGRHIVVDESTADGRATIAALLRLAEATKRKLAAADNDDTEVDMRDRSILTDERGRPVQVNERITRATFKNLIANLLKDTTEASRRALQKANADISDLHKILLVGGSSYGPWVVDALRTTFPNIEAKLFYPDFCVGAGAAIHAKMVLPMIVQTGHYAITLDVPETSLLATLSVSGRVTRDDGKSLEEGFIVTLDTGESGHAPRTASLNAVGGFLLGDVELDDDDNEMTLVLKDAEGKEHLRHSFAIRYTPEQADDISGIQIVLPKPLLIETVDGPVLIAAEGSALPVRCTMQFMRINSNSVLTLRLFQHTEPIGEVRMEGLPPELGEGSPVALDLEITEKNEVRGTAVITSKDRALRKEQAVSVVFLPADVPPFADLREHLSELRSQFDARRNRYEGDDTGTLIETGSRLIACVERLLRQTPVERQEVVVALRALNEFLNPPEDKMEPTLDTFKRVLAECNSLLATRRAECQQRLRSRGWESEALSEERQQARKDLEKCNRLAKQFRQLKEEGNRFHNERDQGAWARTYDALTDLEATLRKKLDIGPLPAITIQLMGKSSISRTRNLLEEEVRKLRAKGTLRDNATTIDGIEKVLEQAEAVMAQVTPLTESEQALAIGRMMHANHLAKAEAAIRKLGHDIEIHR